MISGAAENPIRGMAAWFGTAPMRLLAACIDGHPMGALARSNDVGLAFSPGDTHIVAVTQAPNLKPDGTPEGTFRQVIDSDGTAILDALFASLAVEVGGLAGLQSELYDQLATCGLAVVEGVPGKSGEGLADICTADPLTFRFRDTLTERILEQNQLGEWRPMNPQTVFAVPFRGSRDNPYGKPGRGAALSELLRDFANQRRLDDILQAIAWPRLGIGFPLDETVKFATENPEVLTGQAGDGGDWTPIEFAFAKMAEFTKKIGTIKHDDTLVYVKDSSTTVLNVAQGLQGLKEPQQMNRHRLVMALDQLPTLMGIDSGGTLAYASTQWRVYTKKLEYMRGLVNGIIVMIANLELRLRGLPLTARADVEPIRTSDKLADEQARSIQIVNEYRLVDEGAQSEEDASMNLTGHGPFGPRKPDAESEDEGAGGKPKEAALDIRENDNG